MQEDVTFWDVAVPALLGIVIAIVVVRALRNPSKVVNYVKSLTRGW